MNNEEMFKEYPHLGILRTAVRQALFNSVDQDTIVDRVLFLIEGDIDKVEMLASGIPIDFLNVQERLKAEDVVRRELTNVKNITKINVVNCKEIRVVYTSENTRYIEPGNVKAREDFLTKGYTCENYRISADSVYTEAVTFTDNCESTIPISKFLKAGVKFETI